MKKDLDIIEKILCYVIEFFQVAEKTLFSATVIFLIFRILDKNSNLIKILFENSIIAFIIVFIINAIFSGYIKYLENK